MPILTFIYFLGIVYIVFGLIWFFLARLPKMFLSGGSNSRVDDYLLKIVQYYFIASLTGMRAVDYINNGGINSEKAGLYIVIGGFVLYLYLAGKLERNKAMFKFTSNIQQLKSSGPLKFEPHLVGLTILLYIVSFNFPQIIDNSINHWLLESIYEIKETIIVGWIIGIIGFFFLISMVFKGIQTTGKLIRTGIALVTGKEIEDEEPQNPFQNMGGFGGNNPFEGFQQEQEQEANVDDDMYVDFEIVEDDEEEEEK